MLDQISNVCKLAPVRLTSYRNDNLTSLCAKEITMRFGNFVCRCCILFILVYVVMCLSLYSNFHDAMRLKL